MKKTNKSGRRILSVVLSVLMVLSLFPSTFVTVYADEVGGLTITATDGGTLTEGFDYSYENGKLTILSNRAVTISNTNGVENYVSDTIYVASDVYANITLAGVNIESSNGAALEIANESTGDVNITLAADTVNTLKTTSSYHAALQKNGNVELIGKLTIDGAGELYAYGGNYGAGIGGGDGWSVNDIEIVSGTITANGLSDGAGIGGGQNGSATNITISGGAVNATSVYGAGIGGGRYGSGEYITVSGGTVYAESHNDGAGIGGGYEGIGNYIKISGGNVSARGEYGSGIGGGTRASGENILISGGTVYADSYSDGAGIGGGCDGRSNNVIISGGNVKAYGKNGAAIGGGNRGNGENITICGGVVSATTYDNGAGIGGGCNGGAQSITISGGTVNANGAYGRDIGNGNHGYSSDMNFVVTGGTISASDYNEAPTDENDQWLSSYQIYNYTDYGIKMTAEDGTEYMYPMGKHVGDYWIGDYISTYLPYGTYDIQIGTTIYHDVNDSYFNPNSFSGTTSEVTVGTDLTIVPTNSGEELYYLKDYSYEDGVLLILSDKAMTIYNTNGTDTAVTDRIKVYDYVNANITLAGVNIAPASGAAFEIAENSTGSVTVTLADNTVNTLTSPIGFAGLQKNGEGFMVGSLTIDGNGEIVATGTGGWDEIEWQYVAGAGIGGGDGIHGGYGANSGNITINGGTITAIGGKDGAGIGGCQGSFNNPIYEGVGSNITINGGVITATGGEYGAGIGGHGAGNKIKINGGTVTAIGGLQAAGIGGGNGSAGTNIAIRGGMITATSGNDAAGIGGGAGGNGVGSNITISGGNVTARGDEVGAGIGGGIYASASDITISGGNVTATSDERGAGIGGGSWDSGYNITISGGIVTASSGIYGAGIGGGYEDSGSNIKITGGTVTATGASDIGNGAEATTEFTNIIIDGSSMKATDKQISTTPVNLNGENVYLLIVSNPESKDVYIGDEKYIPVNHTALDENDTNLYAYVTGKNHWVQVGDGEKILYVFDEETETFAPCSHTGGQATYYEKAICDVCEKEYGDFLPDTTAPTVEIKLTDTENKWTEFINLITFGLFFKDTQTVEITAEDEEVGSGVQSISYYIDDGIIVMTPDTADQVSADWKDYTGSFNIDPSGEYVIYAKVTDIAGNVRIINTDGLVIDSIFPILNVKNHDVFCEAVEVLIDEKYIDTVKVNGEQITVTDGKFVLTPDEETSEIPDTAEISETVETPDSAVKTIEVADKAGNVTTVTVYSFDGHDYGEWILNENDPTEHIHTCVNCNEATETEKHNGGTATYDEQAVCDDCKTPYGDTTPDTTVPTAEIKVKENVWNTFLNTITFGLYFGETQQVTITAEDTESGVKSISYYLDDGAMTPDQAYMVADEDWTEYDGAFDIDPDGNYVIYAKITDNDGNVVIINSDGLVLDATNPVFDVKDGDVFCEAVEVTVVDDNIKTVTVNGEEVILTDGKFTVIPNDGENVLVAKDKADNEISIKITVYNGHDYGEWELNENDPTEHIHTCVNCNEATETEKHKGGNATYTEQAICEDCNTPYGDTAPDTTVPTAEIKVKDNVWNTFLNTITFGLYFGETQQVTITAEDSESGVKSISYYLNDGAMTPDQAYMVADEDWTEYDGAFDIDPDGNYVIYAKITDNDGNVVIINSDGLVLDATNPVFSVKDGDVFCEAVEVTVVDDNIKTVTVNGDEVTLTDGKFTVTSNNGENVLIATDKAGNETTVTISVYDNHDYENGVCNHCGDDDPNYIPPVDTETDPDTETETDEPTDPDTETETDEPTDPDTDPDTETETDEPTDPDTETETDDPTDPDTETETDEPTDPDTDTETDDPTDPDTETETDEPTDPDTDTETDEPTDPDTDTETDEPTDPDTETETDEPTDPDTDTETDEPTDPDTDTETDEPTDPDTETETDEPTDPDTETETDEPTDPDTETDEPTDPDTETETDEPTDPDTETDTDETVLCVYGDVNYDGRATAIDAFILQRHLVGYHELTDYQNFIGDVNDDGKINTLDCLDILRYAIGYDAQFWTGREVRVPAEYLKEHTKF